MYPLNQGCVWETEKMRTRDALFNRPGHLEDADCASVMIRLPSSLAGFPSCLAGEQGGA